MEERLGLCSGSALVSRGFAIRPSRVPSFFVLAFYRVSKENKRLLAVYNNVEHHHEINYLRNCSFPSNVRLLSSCEFRVNNSFVSQNVI